MQNDALGKYSFIVGNNKLTYNTYNIYHAGNVSDIKSDLGFGSFAYINSLSFGSLTNKPTTLSGYGITDALSLSGGTLTSENAAVLTLNSNYPTEVSVKFTLNNNSKGYVGYDVNLGAYLYNSVATKSINIKDDGVAYAAGYKILTENNYNSYAPKLNGTGATGIWDISISGNADSATKATQDASGNVITSTYFPKTGGRINGTVEVSSGFLMWRLNAGAISGYFENNNLCAHKDYAWTATVLSWDSSGHLSLHHNLYVSGNVGIGASSTNYKLYVNGDSYISGNLLTGGGVTMYSQRSLKNVVDEEGLTLEELSSIKPTRYTWKDNRDSNIHFGGIADDIQQVLPEVVYKTKEGILTMDYGNAGFAIAASLIKPVIDHEQRIKALEKENELLKQELNRLRA